MTSPLSDKGSRERRRQAHRAGNPESSDTAPAYRTPTIAASPTRSRPGGTLTTEAIVGDGGGFHTSQGDSSALANARRAMNEGVDTVLEMSDDGESRPTPILVSDAERERSIALLRLAVGEGRLTLEEFSERVGHAYAARTDQELASLAQDLPGNAAASATPAAVSEEHRAFCSHLIRSGPWSLPRRSSWRSIFGTIDLDLRQARLVGPETVLEVYNLFGTVTVIVPEGVEVVVRGGGLFASQKIESPEGTPVAGGPRVTIDTRGPGGTLHVRTRPPYPTVKQSIKRAKQSIRRTLK